MALLTFNNKYVITSTTGVSTTSGTLQNDTQASQTFTLTATQTVFAIYQSNSVQGSTQHYSGIRNAISVDGTDYGITWDSGYDTGYTTRNTTFWIGSLAAGSHTIIGRFSNTTGSYTATISNRTLIIYILNGDEFRYLDDTTTATTSAGAWVNDTPATFTFTPSASCKTLFLYNIGNQFGATEDTHGKGAAIRVGATDYALSYKSPDSSNYSASCFTAWLLSLTSTSTTVQGRWGSAGVGYTVTINRRQLGVLMFDDSALIDTLVSTNAVTTTSATMVNDTEATITRTTTSGKELLTLATGSRTVDSGVDYGECYGISVNGSDKANSRGSPANRYVWNGASPIWAQNIQAGAHTIRGRISTNSGTNTARIDYRTLIALWLGSSSLRPPTYGFINHSNPGIL